MKLLEQKILNYSDLPTMPLPSQYTRYGVFLDCRWPGDHYRYAVVQAQSIINGTRYYIRLIEGENNAWLNVKADRVKFFELKEDAEICSAKLKKLHPLK